MTDSLSYIPFCIYDTAEMLQQVPQQPMSFDSLFNAFARPDPVSRESLFSHHALLPAHDAPVLAISTMPPDWVFGVFLVMLCLFCLFFKAYRIKLSLLGQSLFNSRTLTRMLRDNNLSHHNLVAPILLLFTLIMGTLAYFVCSHSPQLLAAVRQACSFVLSDFVVFLAVWLAVLLLYVFRNLLHLLMGGVFEMRTLVQQIGYTNSAFHLFESIVLFPLVLLLFYLPTVYPIMLYVVAVLALVFFVMRIIRALQLVLSFPNSSKFYLFYYLCIVELIPVAVLILLVLQCSLGS